MRGGGKGNSCGQRVAERVPGRLGQETLHFLRIDRPGNCGTTSAKSLDRSRPGSHRVVQALRARKKESLAINQVMTTLRSLRLPP